jgi:hypothetical protein
MRPIKSNRYLREVQFLTISYPWYKARNAEVGNGNDRRYEGKSEKKNSAMVAAAGHELLGCCVVDWHPSLQERRRRRMAQGRRTESWWWP